LIRSETPNATITTAKDILLELKRVLVSEQVRKLNSVRTFKLGVLPPQPTFPAINIMPDSESYEYTLPGGKYKVLRNYLIEVFSRHRSPAEAMNQTRDLVGLIKQVVKENIRVNDQSIDVEIFPRVFEETITFQGQFLQAGTIPIRAHSYEFMPENRLEANTLVPTTSSELIGIIHRTLDYHRSQPPPLSLRNIVQIEKSRIPPVANFPALTVIEPQLDQNREYAGLDAGDRLFELTIWTRLLDKDPMLLEALDILEVIKDIVQIHHMWEGRSMLSRILSVTMSRESLEIGKVYRTTVRMVTKSEEINPI